ncbi:hypothetical protein TNCV_541981 [Trichonephila clavipes]|nr:hypothetical protein TNCV_541981 [Trichonephila clavipes]
MPSGRTSRVSQLTSAGSLGMSEPLALKTAQRVRNNSSIFFYCNSPDLNHTLIRKYFKDFRFRSAQQIGFGNDTTGTIKGFRTSLAGLVLDSATTIGLGRASHSAMQDPIQAPPGTTRQAGLCTS